MIELATGREHGPFDSESDVALCFVFEKLDRDRVEIVKDAPVAELPSSRVNELLPWNWKADRNHTLATYAGARRTPLFRLSRTRVLGAHVPWSLPDGYSSLSSENLPYEAAIPAHDSF